MKFHLNFPFVFQSHDAMVVIFAFELFWSLFITYACCELGHRVRYAFEGIGHGISQLRWYSLPIDVQRILPVFISGVQQPIGLDVFGSISCGRQEFKTVNSNRKETKHLWKMKLNKITFLGRQQRILILYDSSWIWKLEFIAGIGQQLSIRKHTWYLNC